MKLFVTIVAVVVFGNVQGTSPIRQLPPVDDQIVCTMQYVICPPGQQRIVNGCQQSCVPCGEISPPFCPKGYIARLNPAAENTCASYSCVPRLIKPPIYTLPVEPYPILDPPIYTLPVEPYPYDPPIYTLPVEPAVEY